MIIKRLETFSNEYAGFVRLTAQDGSTGWGVEINPHWLERAHYQISEIG